MNRISKLSLLILSIFFGELKVKANNELLPLHIDSKNLEFRTLKKDQITQNLDQIAKCNFEFLLSQKTYWYVSFLKVPFNELGLKEICGKFEHGNFNGFSYIIDLSEQAKESLNEILINNPLISIWDFISCKNPEVFLKKDEKDLLYRVYIKSLGKCIFEW
mgnify:CR=1 FL=1